MSKNGSRFRFSKKRIDSKFTTLQKKMLPCSAPNSGSVSSEILLIQTEEPIVFTLYI